MRLIEPCCASKQFMLLRDAIGKNGKTQFEGYGDLSLTELLPAILTRYSETEMMIIAPSIPDQASDIIYSWMKRQWARMDGKGKLDCISKLTIIADLKEGVSPKASAWLKDNPFKERLALVDETQSDTVLLLPDIAIIGPLNMRYGKRFICTVTTIPEEVSSLWKSYTQTAKPVKHLAKNATEANEHAKVADKQSKNTNSRHKTKEVKV